MMSFYHQKIKIIHKKLLKDSHQLSLIFGIQIKNWLEVILLILCAGLRSMLRMEVADILMIKKKFFIKLIMRERNKLMMKGLVNWKFILRNKSIYLTLNLNQRITVV